MKRIFVVLVLLMLTSSAQAEWLHNKMPVTDSPYAKTNGDFGVMLVFSDKPDELFEAWNQDTLGVKADFVEKVKVNQPVVAVIIFSNCAADKRGNANVTVVFTVIDPDGKTITKTAEVEVWVNRPAPKYRNLELSVDHIRILVEDGQKTGTYIVKALVHDKVARKKLSLEHKLEVVK